MKANEFIKKHGWEKVKRCKKPSSRDNFFIVGGEVIRDQDLIDLKRLVESHDLIDLCGGLEQARAYAIDANACGAFNDEIKLKQAILDVESCQ